MSAAYVIGIVVDHRMGETLAAFWERVETHGLSTEFPAVSPDDVRTLVEACSPGSLHLCASSGTLNAAGLNGIEYDSVGACLTGALREVRESGGRVLVGVIGCGGTILTLCRSSDTHRDGATIYARIDEEFSSGREISGETPAHFAAAILSVYYRVIPPGLVRGAALDRAWPWVYPVGRSRSLLLRVGDATPIAISEAAGSAEPARPISPTRHLFLLSAPDIVELIRRVDDLRDRAKGLLSEDLSRLVMKNGRASAGEHRLALVAASRGELIEKLNQAGEMLRKPRDTLRTGIGLYYGHGPVAGKLALLFPGQGSQYPGMLREIMMQSSKIRSWFDHLDAAYERAGEAPPSAVWNGTMNQPERLFDLETGAQLGLAASLAMYELLLSLGIQPDCMLGHSNGEHAALVAAGVIPASDRAWLCDELCHVGIAARNLQPPAIPEGMIAVSPVKRRVLDPLLEEYSGQLFLAIDNCPSQVLLGGTVEVLETARGVLRKAGAICAVLPFERAHHTPLFSDWATLLRSHYLSVPTSSGHLPAYSTATADRFPSDAASIRELMADQWCRTVRFREAVERLYNDGVRIFVETGPDSKLCSFVSDTLRGKAHIAISASSSIRDDISSLLHTCATLFACGIALRTDVLDQLHYGANAQPASRPSSSFGDLLMTEHRATMAIAAGANSRVERRVRLGVDSFPAVADSARTWPLTGSIVSRTRESAVFSRIFEVKKDPFLRDHAMGGSQEDRSIAVFAFTLTTALAAEAAVRFAGGSVVAVSQVRAIRWLTLDSGQLPLRIEVSRLIGRATNREHGTPVKVRIYELTSQGPALTFEAIVTVGVQTKLLPQFSDPTLAFPPRRWTAATFYKDYAFHGPSYRTMRKVGALAGNGIEADLTVTPTPGVIPQDWHLDVSLLDAAGQLAAFWLLESGAERPGLFPFALEELRVGALPPTPGTPVFCRGVVKRSAFGTTRASFDFVLPDGRILYQVRALEQKIVSFPGPLAACLFGKADALSICEDLQVPTGIFASWIDPERANFLQANQGLWGRVLARTSLSPEEFAQFTSLSADAQVPWLLSQIAMRHALRQRAAASGDFSDSTSGVAVCARSEFAAAVAVAASDRSLRLTATPGSSQPPEPGSCLIWQGEVGGYHLFLHSD